METIFDEGGHFAGMGTGDFGEGISLTDYEIDLDGSEVVGRHAVHGGTFFIAL